MSARWESEDGSIRGTVKVLVSSFGNNRYQEVSLFTEPWRGALSLYINAAGVTAPILGNLIFRVYAKTNGVRAMVRQFSYLERFPDVYPTIQWGSDPQRGKRDVLVGRLTGVECDEIEVVALSLLTYTAGNVDPSFVVTYALRAPSALAPRDTAQCARFYTFPVVPPGGPKETTKFRITTIGGTLHQLWAVNRTANDQWLYLFDDDSGSIGGGSEPRIPPIYVPPNGRGIASIDWGAAPLEALMGWIAVASSSATNFTYDAAANLAVGVQIS